MSVDSTITIELVGQNCDCDVAHEKNAFAAPLSAGNDKSTERLQSVQTL